MEPNEPPRGWEVLAEQREDGVRWSVRRVGRRRPAAWGLTDRVSAVRWAWRLAGPGRRRTAAQPADEPAAPTGTRLHEPWWAVKD